MNEIASNRTKSVVEREDKLLVGYVLAGYPDERSFMEVMEILGSSPLDILEIGFASANPYRDGSVIAAAHAKVDRSICCSLDYWKEIRTVTDKPIWLMAYAGDFIDSGIYKEFCKERVIDGLVIPDLDEARRVSLLSAAKDYGIDVVGFSNPSMDDCGLDDIFSTFPLVYEQLYVGETGKGSSVEMYHHMLDVSLRYPDVTGLAGSGISTREQVERKFKEGFCGTIIGTAIVRHMNESFESLKNYLEDLGRAKETWR